MTCPLCKARIPLCEWEGRHLLAVSYSAHNCDLHVYCMWCLAFAVRVSGDLIAVSATQLRSAVEPLNRLRTEEEQRDGLDRLLHRIAQLRQTVKESAWQFRPPL